MTTAENLVQELTGCFFADPGGMIGQCQSDGAFAEDRQLTAQLGGVVTQIFQALDRDPEQGKLLIGYVYAADQDKPWNSPTIAFTDPVVETLYPVHGVRTGVLTSFQKRNREHSVFQGIELLLNYRRETFPDRAVFCPILAHRDRYLSEYIQTLPDRAPDGNESATPVLEVINLFGLTTFDNPCHANISQLCARIAQSMIDKKVRKDLTFSFDAKTGSRAIQEAAASAMQDNLFASAQYSNAHSLADQHQDQLASNIPDGAFVTYSTQDSSPEQRAGNPFVGTNQTHPDHLRRFGMFASLDIVALGELAELLSLESASPGTQLIVRGAVDPWFYFLLEGIVALKADDGHTRRIEAGSEPARQPLSRLLPRIYDVSAMTPIKFIRAHKQVLEKYFTI